MDYLSASEKEVVHIGGRGSAKSLALIMEPIAHFRKGDYKVLLLRKHMKDLIELISRCKKYYTALFPEIKWREQDKMFVMPNEVSMTFGYFEDERDIERYQGQQYQAILIDELSQLSSEDLLDGLLQSLRGGNPDIPNVFRATCNPGGIGWKWVRNRYVLPANLETITYTDELGEERTYRAGSFERVFEYRGERLVTTCRTIVSTVFNNPWILKHDPEYVNSLASIANERKRRMWLDGDLDVVDGLAFDEFDPKKHVVPKFYIPDNWVKFRCCDWGYTQEGVCLWIAVAPDGTHYVYREFVFKGLNAEQAASEIMEREAEEYISYGILDASCWEIKGTVSESIARTMINCGLRWKPAGNKTRGSRVSMKQVVHYFLADNIATGKPRLQIFENCKKIISTFQNLPLSEHDLEDVDTNADDHAYDALRYGLATRKITSKRSGYFLQSRPSAQPINYGNLGF